MRVWGRGPQRVRAGPLLGLRWGWGGASRCAYAAYEGVGARRGAVGFPFASATAAMSAEIRFNDLAEIWLPPEDGHPLQVAFAAEMARLGEAVDYPIYDWIGRNRPPPGSF